MFFTHDRSFEEFFCICIQLLNKTWKEMRATSEDFNKVRVRQGGSESGAQGSEWSQKRGSEASKSSIFFESARTLATATLLLTSSGRSRCGGLTCVGQKHNSQIRLPKCQTPVSRTDVIPMGTPGLVRILNMWHFLFRAGSDAADPSI